jgi:hypothetical protein
MESFSVIRLHSEMGRRFSRFEQARRDDLDAIVKKEVVKWTDVIKRTGAKVD